MTINNLIGPVERDAHDLYFFRRKYKLGPEIGRGGFGVVYAGYRIQDRLEVAIKYVARRNITEWSTLDGRNVPLEIDLLEKCKNLTGVIKIIDWYERQDGYFVVMEKPSPFCDLFDFISERGALDEVLARSIFKQIVETAVACKNVNVIHRDIKDENIILDISNGQIKLIDFGSGAFLRPGNYTDFEGTRVYAPCEWILYQSYDGLKATVWSLGILLFDMCDGNIPFNSDQEICSGRINWKSHISADCRDLIQKCLMLDPKKRCSLQDILKHKWMQGPTQKLGPHNLSIKKQQLNGIGKPNPEEQDFGTTQIATTSSNAEKTIDVHQRPATSIQEKQESTIVVEKTEEKAPEFDNEENLSRASSSQEVKQDEESDESDEEDEASILERNMKVMKEDVDRLFANNNTDMPLWWKLSITQAITEDSRNNNSNIISPIERKAPGFYCQKYRGGAGSDQNLPSSILYIGTPATKVNHPSSSLYGKDRSKGNKNSSWNEPKKQTTCFPTGSISITQPIYRKTSNTAVYPATIAGFNGMASKINLANLAAGRRPQHHRSTGQRMNQLKQSNSSTLSRGSKSSSIGRQDSNCQNKPVDRKSAIDSGFSSGSNGYVLSRSPPGGSFILGSY